MSGLDPIEVAQLIIAVFVFLAILGVVFAPFFRINPPEDEMQAPPPGDVIGDPNAFKLLHAQQNNEKAQRNHG